MTARTPAPVRRAEAKAAVARALTRALYESGVEQRELAEATGASTSVVQRWTDRDRLETLSLADLALLGEDHPDLAHRLMRWMGGQLGLVVSRRLEVVPSDPPGGLLEHLARRAKEHAETTSALLEGLATEGGRLTPAELVRVDRELRDEEELLAELRALVDEEISSSRRAV